MSYDFSHKEAGWYEQLCWTCRYSVKNVINMEKMKLDAVKHARIRTHIVSKETERTSFTERSVPSSFQSERLSFSHLSTWKACLASTWILALQPRGGSDSTIDITAEQSSTKCSGATESSWIALSWLVLHVVVPLVRIYQVFMLLYKFYHSFLTQNFLTCPAVRRNHAKPLDVSLLSGPPQIEIYTSAGQLISAFPVRYNSFYRHYMLRLPIFASSTFPSNSISNPASGTLWLLTNTTYFDASRCLLCYSTLCRNHQRSPRSDGTMQRD